MSQTGEIYQKHNLHLGLYIHTLNLNTYSEYMLDILTKHFNIYVYETNVCSYG